MDALLRHLTAKFTNFGWVDVFDLIITAFVMYWFFIFLKKNNAAIIFKVLAGAAVVATLIFGVGMPVTSKLIEYAFIAFILLIVIIFSGEIKRGIWRINSGHKNFHSTKGNYSEEEIKTSVAEIVKACQNLAKNDVGALIVISRNNMPRHIIDSGTILNATISSQLIESIFNTKAPLHDGAIIIDDNKIIAAGCFLPLSQELNIPKELGTRHRAGIGITEAQQVLSIIVSEETGIISMVENGKLKRYIDGPILTDKLLTVFGIAP